jgi:hypothetical protein
MSLTYQNYVHEEINSTCNLGKFAITHFRIFFEECNNELHNMYYSMDINLLYLGLIKYHAMKTRVGVEV